VPKLFVPKKTKGTAKKIPIKIRRLPVKKFLNPSITYTILHKKKGAICTLFKINSC
jgi:hypothetical protein